MNYGWARDFTLELINQYSVAGTKVPEAYNNQADYLNRIPKLLDDAQFYVATTAGRMRDTVDLEELPRSERGDWYIYNLPSNCWQVCAGCLIRFDGPEMRRYHQYRMMGKSRLAVPKALEGLLSVEYFRYPAKLGDNPKDSTPLDNTEEAQRALPYYVAAHLLMHDNPFAYSALYNEFEAKLGRLYEEPQTEPTIIQDVYSATEWDYNN
jgi:hypothetical protein